MRRKKERGRKRFFESWVSADFLLCLFLPLFFYAIILFVCFSMSTYLLALLLLFVVGPLVFILHFIFYFYFLGGGGR